MGTCAYVTHVKGIEVKKMSTEWYMYPLDNPSGSYGKIMDPLASGKNPYLKPDVNIAVPQGTPITALLPGTVTDVSDHGGCCGGLSVTVALDHPLNSLATHVSYNFLGNAHVVRGQKVLPGQVIATAGSRYGILTAVGLTPDNTWGGSSFNLNAKGEPLLDPHILLNPIRGGKSLTSDNTSSTSSSSNNPASNWPFGLGALQSSFINFTEEVAVFLIALVVIILGVMLLAGKQIGGFAKGTAKTGAKAAVLA